MKFKHLKFGKGFRVVFDTRRGQAAEMVISPGDAEGDASNRHRGADQWLFVVAGSGRAIVNGRAKAFRTGDLLLIEKNDRHEIRNTGRTLLRTLNFYTPPAYTKSGNPNRRGNRAKVERYEIATFRGMCPAADARGSTCKGDVMAQQLNGKTVAILATDGFEQAELEAPKSALENAGANVDVIAPKAGEIQGLKHMDKGDTVRVDHTLDEVSAQDYDAIVLPGGVFNPDQLRTNDKAIAFVRDFFAAHKPVGAICHGPWTLIEAGVVEGRTMTSVKSIHSDLQNAGANWVDEEVVVDNGLVTSRTPKDLDAFCSKLIEEIGEGRHAGQTAGSRTSQHAAH